MGNSKSEYIVRVTDAQDPRFLKQDCGGSLDVTDCPSFALLLDYDSAVAWVKRLHAKGHPRAVVCDTRGYLMTFDRLQARDRAAATAVDDLPRSWSDYDRIPAAEMRRRRKVDSAFADAVDRIEATPRTASRPQQTTWSDQERGIGKR
jgi:hypothetical protein